MSSSMSRLDVKYGAFWRVSYAVLLGQLVSFALALMSFNSSLSANLGVNAPFTLAFFSYLALTLVFGSVLLYRRQKLHFFGAALCVTGLCLVLLSDSGVGGGGGSNPVVGDVLVIAATCCVALSNVGEELCVKKVSRIEVVTMLGLFGTLVSVVEMAIFERKNLESISWSPEVILTFAGYGIANFMFHSLTPLVLLASGATLFNLSLLTADMWAVVIRVFLYHQKVDWLYYVSFLVVGIGLVIYLKTEMHSNELPKLENGDTDQPYQLLPEEGVRV